MKVFYVVHHVIEVTELVCLSLIHCLDSSSLYIPY